MTLHQFDTRVELAQQLAGRIARDLESAIARQGTATLAVSGGSTPLPLFEELSNKPIDWSRVFVTQVDERWVDEDHPDSNARMIRQKLLRHRAASACFVSMKTADEDVFKSEAAAARALSVFGAAIDVLVLGMGDDGHTASFFAGASTLHKALDPESKQLCVAIRPPQAPHDRMTLSLAAILRSRHLYLHITGSKKWSVLQRAELAGEVAKLPIRAILNRSDPSLEVFYCP